MDSHHANKLQTLKQKPEKIPLEDQFREIDLALESVRRQHKPTVATRRFDYDSVEDKEKYDPEMERRRMMLDESINNLTLKETMPKIQIHINRLTKEYEELLVEYKKLRDDVKSDQDLLKNADTRIHEIFAKRAMYEDIKQSLFKEVKKLVVENKKMKEKYDERMEKARNNFKEITEYLQSQLDTERNLLGETNKVLRGLENKFRETVYQLELSEDQKKLLVEELKKSRDQFRTLLFDTVHKDLLVKKL